MDAERTVLIVAKFIHDHGCDNDQRVLAFVTVMEKTRIGVAILDYGIINKCLFLFVFLLYNVALDTVMWLAVL